MSYLLGVERSVSNKRWVERPHDERLAIALAQRLGVSALTARVMAARGVTLETADHFLSPTLRDLLPDPSHFKDMETVVARTVEAIEHKQSIAIFGDYDVDGATSSALLVRFFKGLGITPRVYIPDRMSEGYGPNAQAFETLKQEGVDLIITVDCGTTAFEPLEYAAEQNLDVIVIDHHEADVRLPPCVGVVNPKRLDEDGQYASVAAVGMAFIFAVGVNRALREAGWLEKQNLKPVNLLGFLDIVALGTVCDVVPLVGLNRAFVIQGLKVMAGRQNMGITALSDVAGVAEAPEAYHAGFVFGPRVNAGGRVGESYLGTRLLATDNPAEAAELAARLDGYNQERKSLEQEVLEAAITQVETDGVGQGFVCAVGHGWHPGVIGIVASRLKERYSLPACVISVNEDGVGHGSGRSVSGVDLGSAVLAARQAGLLLKGGGHAMAAGFTVAEAQRNHFIEFLETRLSQQIAQEEIVPTYRCDGVIAPNAVTPALVEELEQIGPFGAGNAQPKFILPEVSVQRADVVGKDHVRCFLTDSFGVRLKAIAFRALDSELGQLLLNHGGKKLHVAGRLKLDTWGGGSSVQVILEDAVSL